MYDPRHRRGHRRARHRPQRRVVLAADALEGSIFRMLRQGQRVIFDLDAKGHATHVRIGAEGHGPAPDIQV